MNWWDRFLFRDRGIVPTKRLLVVLVVLSVALIVAAIFLDLSWPFVFAVNGMAIAASLLDLFFSPRKREVQIQREVVPELERDASYEIKLKVANQSAHICRFRFVDSLPQTFHRPFPLGGTVKGGSAVEVKYETNAPVRGNYSLDKLYFRYGSSLGLWEKQVTVTLEAQVKVIPDLTDVKSYLEDAQRFFNV